MEKVVIFNSAFDNTHWGKQEDVDFLREELKKIEKVISKYLIGIRVDFPELTDHSLEDHSKMLWNYADLIVGEKERYLNPMEAFVLHVAFLIHDAGMSMSTLNNIEEIKRNSIYTDYITEKGDTEENHKNALFMTVRQLHGEFAYKISHEVLAEDEYLIENIELREELGKIIGKIAKSHTMGINYIEQSLSYYTCPKYPFWKIDCQKLAYILRVSDAAHLDNRRTPKTNKMIEEIPGVSKHHWTFQKKLGFPSISDDNLLIYPNNASFKIDEQKAWWFCYSALKDLDRELRDAKLFFEINRSPEINIRAIGVKSIGDTLELGNKYIITEGWKAIDTTIKATQPVRLALELGGITLYQQSYYAIRELIQNGIDAVNLLRYLIDHTNTDVGEINVSLIRENNAYYLVVSDDGIGMSPILMANNLLDFGASYWKSNDFYDSFKGIVSRGFQSIGKYGIGFFSVFMLGKYIKVTSWKYGDSIDSIKTLDFFDGLDSGPILREPTLEEKGKLVGRGTKIKMRLDINPYVDYGLIKSAYLIGEDLYDIVKYFIPAANVKINIYEINGKNGTIYPTDISKLSLEELINCLNINTSIHREFDIINIVKRYNLEIVEIRDSEKLYGKLLIVPDAESIGYIYSNTNLAIVESRGIRVNTLDYFIGYISTDEIDSAKRDSFVSNISFEVLKEWAILHKEMIERKDLINIYKIKYANLLIAFQLHDENTTIALKKVNNTYGPVSIREIREYLRANNSINFYSENPDGERFNPTVDGFLMLPTKIYFNKVIQKSDILRITNIDELLPKIIAEEWEAYSHGRVDMMGYKPNGLTIYNSKSYFTKQ